MKKDKMFRKIQKTLDFCNWASAMSIGNFHFPLDDNTFKEENCYNQRMDYSAVETKDGETALLFWAIWVLQMP